MPRKKREVEDLNEDIELVPEKQFEAAMRAVLGASNKRVDERMDELHASNKKRRAAREPNTKTP